MTRYIREFDLNSRCNIIGVGWAVHSPYFERLPLHVSLTRAGAHLFHGHDCIQRCIWQRDDPGDLFPAQMTTLTQCGG